MKGDGEWREGRRHALGSMAVGVSLHGWLLMLDVPHVLMLGVETAPSELIVSSMNGNGEWLGGGLDRKAGFGCRFAGWYRDGPWQQAVLRVERQNRRYERKQSAPGGD